MYFCGRHVINMKALGCGKRFSRPDSLTTHVKTHSNVRPFICPVKGCQKAYYHSRSLKKHEKTHENTIQTSAPPLSFGTSSGFSNNMTGQVPVEFLHNVPIIQQHHGSQAQQQQQEHPMIDPTTATAATVSHPPPQQPPSIPPTPQEQHQQHLGFPMSTTPSPSHMVSTFASNPMPMQQGTTTFNAPVMMDTSTSSTTSTPSTITTTPHQQQPFPMVIDQAHHHQQHHHHQQYVPDNANGAPFDGFRGA